MCTACGGGCVSFGGSSPEFAVGRLLTDDELESRGGVFPLIIGEVGVPRGSSVTWRRILVPRGVGTYSLLGGLASEAVLGGWFSEWDEEVPVPVVSPLEGSSSEEAGSTGCSLR